MNTYTFESETSGRLDKIIVDNVDDISRSRVQALILDNMIEVNDVTVNSRSAKIKVGDKVCIEIPPVKSAHPVAQNIKLDIVFEDEQLLVINKQAGLVVHPGSGNHDGTLVNALLYHCSGSLSGIGGVARPGIVHRLDKDTSGLMIAAKTDKAHQHLSSQLSSRTLKRQYVAIVFGKPLLKIGTVDQPIARDTKNRLKMSVKPNGKTAKTHWKVDFSNSAVSIVTCRLDSGRTHQIRVHMEYMKHPIIGDPLYGVNPNALVSKLKKLEINTAPLLNIKRQALHSKSISFVHPESGKEMHFEAQPPEDIKQ